MQMALGTYILYVIMVLIFYYNCDIRERVLDKNLSPVLYQYYYSLMYVDLCLSELHPMFPNIAHKIALWRMQFKKGIFLEAYKTNL